MLCVVRVYIHKYNTHYIGFRPSYSIYLLYNYLETIYKAIYILFYIEYSLLHFVCILRTLLHVNVCEAAE